MSLRNSPDVPQSSECGDGPIGWGALPELDGREVALRNADLAHLSRRVFSVGGVAVRFERPPGARDAGPALPPAVFLSLEWSGLPLLAGASPALSEAVVQSVANVGLEQLGASGFALFAQLMLSPLLPAGMVLLQGELAPGPLSQIPAEFERLGTWQGRHRDSAEPSGHEITLWAGAGFPLAAWLGACASLASAREPSPLAQLPIPLPLVAARWRVNADQLADLAVGDVLMLG